MSEHITPEVLTCCAEQAEAEGLDGYAAAFRKGAARLAELEAARARARAQAPAPRSSIIPDDVRMCAIGCVLSERADMLRELASELPEDIAGRAYAGTWTLGHSLQDAAQWLETAGDRIDLIEDRLRDIVPPLEATRKAVRRAFVWEADDDA